MEEHELYNYGSSERQTTIFYLMQTVYTRKDLQLPKGFSLCLFSISKFRRQVLCNNGFLFRFLIISTFTIMLQKQESMKRRSVILIRRNLQWNWLRRKWMFWLSDICLFPGCIKAFSPRTLDYRYCGSGSLEERENLWKANNEGAMSRLSQQLLPFLCGALQRDLCIQFGDGKTIYVLWCFESGSSCPIPLLIQSLLISPWVFKIIWSKRAMSSTLVAELLWKTPNSSSALRISMRWTAYSSSAFYLFSVGDGSSSAMYPAWYRFDQFCCFL